jgi:hypothetical protein
MKRFQNLIRRIKLLRLRYQMRPAALGRAKKVADRLHKKNGKRYRVFFFGTRYHVWTRDEIRNRKKSGLFKYGLKAGGDFDRVAFYDTNPRTDAQPCASAK